MTEGRGKKAPPRKRGSGKDGAVEKQPTTPVAEPPDETATPPHGDPLADKTARSAKPAGTTAKRPAARKNASKVSEPPAARTVRAAYDAVEAHAL